MRSRRARLFILFACACAASTAAAQPRGAADDPEEIACKLHFEPEAIVVSALPIQAGVDLSLDVRTLTALEGKAANQRVLGRTVARLRNTSTFQTREQKLPSGRTCMKPAVAVTMAYEPTVVYVGREYPAGSCEFKKILEHEQRHVTVHRQHLLELAPLVQQDLRDFFTGANLVFDLPSYSRRFFQTSIQDVIRARVNKMSGEARARQLEVDSTEEVSRLSDLRGICAQDPPSAAAGG
jgi:hypothetical protein